VIVPAIKGDSLVDMSNRLVERVRASRDDTSLSVLPSVVRFWLSANRPRRLHERLIRRCAAMTPAINNVTRTMQFVLSLTTLIVENLRRAKNAPTYYKLLGDTTDVKLRLFEFNMTASKRVLPCFGWNA
jgi:hypothetical protein